MNTPAFPKCWTQDAIDRYFTSEAMSKSREAFNEVHIPIDRIRVDSSYPAARGREEISETELLGIITNSRPPQPNRIFLIVGDTGSGKSELCQWLNYNIVGNVHVPILIERRMIRLKDIVEKIHQHLGEQVPTDVVEITDLWPETVSATLRAAILMHLQQAHIQNALGTKTIAKLRTILDTPDFERRMRTHFQHYQEELEHLERIRQLELLPEQDFKELVIQAGGLTNTTECYRQVQAAIVESLAHELQVEDLVQKLVRISKSYHDAGKRPVLLIEDITTFGFLQNELLDYLYNLSGGNYDVIMGVTTGFEQQNQSQIYKTQQTITERIEGRFELTDQHNETLFLHRHYLDLAERYLTAIRQKSCRDCPMNSECIPGFDAFYPFNKAFLSKIYRGLSQDNNRKQTPRLYLRAIQSVLESTQLPTQSIELSPNVLRPVDHFSQYGDLNPTTESVLRWYGLDTKVGVFLDKRVVETSGIEFPSHFQPTQGFYCFKLRPGVEGSLPEPPAHLRTEPSVAPPQPEKIIKKSPPSVSPPLSLDVFGELDAWLAHQGQFPDRNVFKDGIYVLLRLYQFSPFTLKHPQSIAESGAPLIFDRGDKYAKLYLHHSADDRPYHKLVIRPDRDKRDLFSQVLAIGSNGYDVTDDRIDHTLLYDWLAGCVQELHQEMKDALRQALRMPLETFVAFTKFLLLNATSEIYTLQPETLIRPVVNEPLVIPAIGGAHARHLWENRDHIQALFVALFHYRDSLTNYRLLQHTLADMNLDHLLQEVNRISVSGFPSGFRTKLSKSELEFQHLVRIVQVYVTDLCNLTRSKNYHLIPSDADLHTILALCAPRGSLKAEKLRLQVDELKQLALTNGVQWESRWDVQLQPLHRNPEQLNFEQLYDDTQIAINSIANAPQPFNIFAYLTIQRQLNSIASQPAFEVLSAISAMRRPLFEVSDKRRAKFLQTSTAFQDFKRACQELQGVMNR